MSDTIYNRNIYVIIPAYNEEKSIAKVINDIPKDLVAEIIVGNNNSKDNTALEAKNAGATVVDAPESGYGNACLKGIEYLRNKANADDIIVFIDGDYSDYPKEIVNIIAPIQNNNADLVIGSRAIGIKEKGSMTMPQEFGNW